MSLVNFVLCTRKVFFFFFGGGGGGGGVFICPLQNISLISSQLLSRSGSSPKETAWAQLFKTNDIVR